MKSAALTLITCLLLLILVLPQSLAQSANKKTSVYCEFEPGTFPLHAHSLPKAVVRSVMHAPESREMLKGEKPADVTPEKLLLGRRIHLATDGATTFLIIGSGVLSSADASWFWIVRQNGKKASILLFDAANCVDLDSSKTHGYRNVIFYWASAGTARTDIFHYNGKVYKLVHEKSRSRGPND